MDYCFPDQTPLNTSKKNDRACVYAAVGILQGLMMPMQQPRRLQEFAVAGRQ
jgi:hypothetical protein